MPGDTGQIGITDDGNLHNVIDFIVRQHLAKISTVRLVKIVAVHLPNNGKRGQVDIAGTVDVQLLTAQLDGAGKATPRGIVYGIPYHRLQSGDSAHIVDPVIGDIGLAHIGDRDLSSNIAARGAANPGSQRRFSQSDSIYYGGILNGQQGKDPKQFLRWHDKGTEWGDHNKNRHTMDDTGMVHTDGVNNNSRVFDKNGIADNTQQSHVTNAKSRIVNAQSDHTINAPKHNINALTNLPNLLKVLNVAQPNNFLSGLTNGGITNLLTGKNLIGLAGNLTGQTFNMPSVDKLGNALTGGLGTSLSVAGGNISGLSFGGGSFASSPPSSLNAGQVLNFEWSSATNSWWNA